MRNVHRTLAEPMTVSRDLVRKGSSTRPAARLRGCAAAIVGDTGTVGPVSAPLCRSWWGHFELTRPPGRYSAIWRALCSPSMIAECRHGTLHRVSLEVGAEDFS